jgi:hypothetical protein
VGGLLINNKEMNGMDQATLREAIAERSLIDKFRGAV